MDVNAFMNGYIPNRMEPKGANRKLDVEIYKKPSPFMKDLFPDNPAVAATFNILKEDYGFTSDMIWRMAEKLNELRKQNEI
ncbi:hypothetical protein F7731_23595 [Cytobacillus depressus]|uniref:Uncharacterized protein n=1 Tax=Cytobacillus depressus TaxID=1602942 RepID=A0A6L3UY48_9BACI|nr:hypothetical protein [Cytobacillus depressus]KAB2328940.1 hypothetical protein F7731_23595 [Cytobacillus depressus]